MSFKELRVSQQRPTVVHVDLNNPNSKKGHQKKKMSTRGNTTSVLAAFPGPPRLTSQTIKGQQHHCLVPFHSSSCKIPEMPGSPSSPTRSLL